MPGQVRRVDGGQRGAHAKATTLPMLVPVLAVAAVPSERGDRNAEASVTPVPSPSTPPPDDAGGV